MNNIFSIILISLALLSCGGSKDNNTGISGNIICDENCQPSDSTEETEKDDSQSSDADSSPGANQNCLRIARNLISLYDSTLKNWSSYGGTITFSSINNEATFDLKNSDKLRLFIGKSISVKSGLKYAISIKVSNFSGEFSSANFTLLGANSSPEIQGVTSLNFTQDGKYSLIFSNSGVDTNYLLRIGIGTTNDDTLALTDGTSKFTISDIMVEEIPQGINYPSEYTVPKSAWGFNFPNYSIYHSSTGLVAYDRGEECEDDYTRVWAITADSFGNDETDFPKLLPELGNYAFFVDAVPGRQLYTASLSIEALLNLEKYPNNLAKPKGLIVEGGVNDILSGSSVDDLKDVVLNILETADSANIPVIFLTIAPFGNNNNWSYELEQVRTEYNSWLLEQADNENIYIYNIAASNAEGGLADNINSTVLVESLSNSDGLHPNKNGQKVIANKLVNLLNKLHM